MDFREGAASCAQAYVAMYPRFAEPGAGAVVVYVNRSAWSWQYDMVVVDVPSRTSVNEVRLPLIPARVFTPQLFVAA